ncbi:MAG: siroheme synthase CysG [Acetobacterales bacterium]
MTPILSVLFLGVIEAADSPTGGGTPMQYFPVYFRLAGRPALLVGGGDAAVRKLRLLRRAGARVTVVALEADGEIARLAADGDVVWQRREFRDDDLVGPALIIVATESAADDRIAEAAREAGVPVNAVDRPELSTFIMPAIVDRDGIVVAISSGGAAPVLARRIRERIEALLPGRVGRLARFAEGFRGAVEAAIPAGPGRRHFWERFFDSPVAAQVLDGDERGARRAMAGLVDAASLPTEGMVYIVGAGPGDPELLTLKAVRLLQQADVIVHDRLIGPEVLDYARRDAERLYVGKARSCHSRSQDEINAVMAEKAREGRIVVRLKGGDPMIFGRGGEEREYLENLGIRVEVVPGITAATGSAAAAGISLTHRDCAQAVTFVTGHARNDGVPDLDWTSLVRMHQTVAVYMGVSSAGAIAGKLIGHGMSPAMPVAVVENATLKTEKVVRGRLDRLAELVRENGIVGPAMIVIGKVAAEPGCNVVPLKQPALRDLPRHEAWVVAG